MSLAGKIKNLFAPKPKDKEPRSIVVLQRKPYRFSKEELISAAEGGWGRRFDGEEDPMYFVSAEHAALTVVKAGPHTIRVMHIPDRYSDNDEYALSQLPQPEQKKAWNDHNACVLLDFFNDFSSKSEKVPDKEAYSSLAKLALQLRDPNCAAVFLPDKNILMPNDGTAEQGLRFLINKELPL